MRWYDPNPDAPLLLELCRVSDDECEILTGTPAPGCYEAESHLDGVLRARFIRGEELSGYSAPLVVPEPGAAGLGIAGLVVVILLYRRRGRRREYRAQRGVAEANLVGLDRIE